MTRPTTPAAIEGYRPEIDGLRAIAVALVILFHFEVPGFGAGFLGVDVFFVISGYLITQIITGELEQGRFTFRAFYTRRARRILPALFATLIVTIIAFAFVQFPWEYQALLRSAGAAVLFLANVHFWELHDYFGTSVDVEPLVHTWSLAVEEHFYLIFPLLMFLCFLRGTRAHAAILVLVLSALSLALAEWGWRNEPRVNFYFSPSRFWELGLGALAALIPRVGKAQTRALATNAAFAILCLSIALFDPEWLTPSVFALPLILATAAFLYGSGTQCLANVFLSNRAFVALGVISYSAYLWHQPVIAFLRLSTWDLSHPAQVLIAIAVTLVLAQTTKILIEDPFRGKSGLYRVSGRVFWACGAAIGAAIIAMFMFELSKPITKLRLGEPLYTLAEDFGDGLNRMKVFGLGGCFVDAEVEITALPETCLPKGPRGVLIVGDSHAAHLTVGVRENLPPDVAFAQINATGVRPMLHSALRPRDRRVVEFLYDLKAPENADWTMVLSAGWYSTLDRTSPEEFETALNDAVARYQQNGFTVFIALQSPVFPRNTWLRELVALGEVPDNLFTESQVHDRVNAILQRVADARNLGTFDTTIPLCKPGTWVCQTVANGDLLYLDASHLSLAGSRMLGKKLTAVILESSVNKDHE